MLMVNQATKGHRVSRDSQVLWDHQGPSDQWVKLAKTVTPVSRVPRGREAIQERTVIRDRLAHLAPQAAQVRGALPGPQVLEVSRVCQERRVSWAPVARMERPVCRVLGVYQAA